MKFDFVRKNFFEPLYYKRAGSPRLDYWKILEKTQYYSLERLKEIQWQRLQALWAFVWKHNAFYQRRFADAGLTKKSLQSPDDISKLPVLTKAEVRAHTSQMISFPFSREKLHHFKTGGSTGRALDLFVTEKCSELRNACARRHDRWTGWEPGQPIAAAWGNPELPVTPKKKMINSLVQPYIYLDTMAVSEASVTRFILEWKKTGPTLLFGHAHSLFVLAQYLERMKLSAPHPVGILSTSMMLLPHERAKIEQVFGCRVIDRYGCEEVSLIGCECQKHEGMHMNIEHLVIEFLREDGSSAGVGEPGEIVVTDLMNHAMPFIRYRVEDVAAFLGQPCSCGRGLPLMEKVQGRVADFLIKKDGTRVAGISLIENTLTRIPGIDQMQIIQESLVCFRLNVVPGKGYGPDSAHALRGYFEDLFGHDVVVNLCQTTKIQPEKSGKYRFSVCSVS
ncbi:phenylacetate--CoA ligase family protein [Desulfocicer niacini]